jgi:hypothetical protein
MQGLAGDFEGLPDGVKGVERLPPLSLPFRRADRIDGLLPEALLTLESPRYLGSRQAPFHT